MFSSIGEWAFAEFLQGSGIVNVSASDRVLVNAAVAIDVKRRNTHPTPDARILHVPRQNRCIIVPAERRFIK